MAKWYANILITVSPHQAWYVRVKRLTRTWYKKHAYHFATPHTLPYHIHHFPPPSGASQNPAEYHKLIPAKFIRRHFDRFQQIQLFEIGPFREVPISECDLIWPRSQLASFSELAINGFGARAHAADGKAQGSDASRGGADCQEAERWRRPRAGQEAFGHQRAREGPRRCAKRKQVSLGDLLSQRTKQARLGEGPANPEQVEPWLDWKYVQHCGGGEELEVPQRQRPNRRVEYDHPDHRDAIAVLLAKGPEPYYVHANHQEEEVEQTHPDAVTLQRHGGHLRI